MKFLVERAKSNGPQVEGSYRDGDYAFSIHDDPAEWDWTMPAFYMEITDLAQLVQLIDVEEVGILIDPVTEHYRGVQASYILTIHDDYVE